MSITNRTSLYYTCAKCCSMIFPPSITKFLDHPSNQTLARLLTLLIVLKLLPSATDDSCIQWLDPVVFPEDESRVDLISGILLAVKQCENLQHITGSLLCRCYRRVNHTGWYSQKINDFKQCLTLECQSTVLWNTTLYHIHYYNYI